MLALSSWTDEEWKSGPHRDLSNIGQRAKHLLEQAEEILSQDVFWYDDQAIDIRTRTVDSQSKE